MAPAPERPHLHIVSRTQKNRRTTPYSTSTDLPHTSCIVEATLDYYWLRMYPQLLVDSLMNDAPPTFIAALQHGSYLALMYANAMEPSDIWKILQNNMWCLKSFYKRHVVA